MAAELMERLDSDYADKEGVTLGTVAVIAEVAYEDGDHEIVSIEYRCSDGRRWIQAGLFAAAQHAVDSTDEEDD